jgi:hypothetical protein
MHRLPLAAAAALCVFVPASAASAATLTPLRRCFQGGAGQKGAARAAEFTPGATLDVSLDKQELGTVTADESGGRLFSFDVPAVPAGHGGELRHVLSATDGTASASAPFYATDFDVVVKPPSGKPNRAVTVNWHGFGAGKVLWLHLVPPRSSRARFTSRIGRGGGACGRGFVHLKHLYPQARPASGLWTLQFDTSKAYHRNQTPRIRFQSQIVKF